jgi:hypothetical protein
MSQRIQGPEITEEAATTEMAFCLIVLYQHKLGLLNGELRE